MTSYDIYSSFVLERYLYAYHYCIMLSYVVTYDTLDLENSKIIKSQFIQILFSLVLSSIFSSLVIL